jgi:lysophospholipase L1-like esterase
MKKIITSLLLFSFMLFWACTPTDPTQPEDESINEGTLVLSKMVAVGNSLTAGVQSTGLVRDFQEHSYPYLIAQQMGQASNFQQPIVESPGIGSPTGYTPQKFDPATGAITQDPLTVNPLTLLSNALLPRAYDNMGIPGFDLNDALNTTSGGMADLVLRNPNFGNTTQLEQTVGLSPTLLILWLGSNDVLGAALDGGDVTQITSAGDFENRLTTILAYIRTELPGRGLVMANIPDVSDIPFVNTLDAVFLGGLPMVFTYVPSTLSFVPIDFTGFGTYIPIMTAELGVTHITLAGLAAYQEGYGIPDLTALVNPPYGLDSTTAQAIVGGLMAQGVTPLGIPLASSMTITATEEQAMEDAVTAFNTTIGNLATTFLVPVFDANSTLSTLNISGIDGFSGKFVMNDPVSTFFSLDGVHPNNAGYAIIANKFIEIINTNFGQSIPEINTSLYGGQYTGALPKVVSQKAIDGVRVMFRKK